MAIGRAAVPAGWHQEMSTQASLWVSQAARTACSAEVLYTQCDHWVIRSGKYQAQNRVRTDLFHFKGNSYVAMLNCYFSFSKEWAVWKAFKQEQKSWNARYISQTVGCNALQQNSNNSVPREFEHKTSSPGYLQNKWKAGMTAKSQEQNLHRQEEMSAWKYHALAAILPGTEHQLSKRPMSGKIQTPG